MGKKVTEPGVQAPQDVAADAAPPLPARGGMYEFVDGQLVPLGGAPTVEAVLSTLGENNEI